MCCRLQWLDTFGKPSNGWITMSELCSYDLLLVAHICPASWRSGCFRDVALSHLLKLTFPCCLLPTAVSQYPPGFSSYSWLSSLSRICLPCLKLTAFKWQISGLGRGGDSLPESHTCFFQLCLPDYPDADTAYNKIRWAIYNCMTMEIA